MNLSQEEIISFQVCFNQYLSLRCSSQWHRLGKQYDEMSTVEYGSQKANS